MEICNIISGNFVGTGMINLPLRLRNERGKIRYSLNIPGRIFNRMVLKEYQKKQCNTTIRTLMFCKNNTLA
ncbi:hypothetical protein [Prevotella pallens]|uniref:hypothetical protein n=1 Tax=Prevotella pallens TaxID=60133 RepID=UPI001CAE3A0C|nr:hypothetical protein [Prevotella pallens]MBF1478361.1 hypothetical protein [Prevotella pallens]MBF1503147.1 hypothetical protein [Prevotella pallens]MBF1518832.1 hypothetical protein [Prevotella pallens]